MSTVCRPCANHAPSQDAFYYLSVEVNKNVLYIITESSKFLAGDVIQVMSFTCQVYNQQLYNSDG